VRQLYLASFSSFISLVAFALLLLTSCEKQDPLIIDTIGVPPQLISLSVTPSTVNSDTINIGSERRPEDILSFSLQIYAKIVHPYMQSQIESAEFSFFRSKREQTISSGLLYDNGLASDAIANDSIFSALIQFTRLRSDIGVFIIEATALDREGYSGNSIRIPFILERLNRPPSLANLVAPDTVFLSSQSSFLISVVASDPDGLEDVISVTRTTPSNMVLFLNDEGVNGDALGGDGVFTELVSLSPPPLPGPYTFRFQALDRSNAPSTIITKTVVVSP